MGAGGVFGKGRNRTGMPPDERSVQSGILCHTAANLMQGTQVGHKGSSSPLL